MFWALKAASFFSPVSHRFIQCSAIRGSVAKQGCFICLSDLSALTWLRQINQITICSFSWQKLQNEMSGGWKSPHFYCSHFSLLPAVTEHHVDILNIFWEFWGCEEKWNLVTSLLLCSELLREESQPVVLNGALSYLCNPAFSNLTVQIPSCFTVLFKPLLALCCETGVDNPGGHPASAS